MSATRTLGEYRVEESADRRLKVPFGFPYVLERFKILLLALDNTQALGAAIFKPAMSHNTGSNRC